MQIFKQESIPVGCVPPTRQFYVFQWLPLDVSMGVCPQMNKFEQVSSDDHQMSVAGGVSQVPGPEQWGTLPCDLFHDACDVPIPRTK